MFEPAQREITIYGQPLAVRSLSRQEATRYRARLRSAGEDQAALDEAMGYLVCTCTLLKGAPAFKNPAEALAVDARAFDELLQACIAINKQEGEKGSDPMTKPPVQT
ncbi:MAG: hypothetical protein WCG26_00165 [Chloroflexales bacterium]